MTFPTPDKLTISDGLFLLDIDLRCSQELTGPEGTAIWQSFDQLCQILHAHNAITEDDLRRVNLKPWNPAQEPT